MTTITPFDVTDVTIEDGDFASVTMDVSNLATTLVDVDLVTVITTDWNCDLDVWLTSPAGTEVTITTGNGCATNVFDGSTWNDDAGDVNPPGPVTQSLFTDFAVFPYVPEEAMGAFIGENPNGTWTLSIDDLGGSFQTHLLQWELTLVATSQTIVEEKTTWPNNSSGPILDGLTLVSTTPVAGLGSFIQDVNLTTNITHPYNDDLIMHLTSPAGTQVTLVARLERDVSDVFAGTVWDDDAGDSNPPGPVTDNSYTDGVVETPLVPEEAMAAFIGEDPNGTWTLSILDVTAPNEGALNGWSLDITTATCAPLPVELVAFEARAQGDDVLLQWSTASETNNSGFYVETKPANDITWESLGFVEGAGTTMEEQSYAFRAHELGPGIHRFRLKQVDFDGAYDYSTEIEVQIEVAGTHQLSSAYPNPFNPSTTFTLVVGEEQHVTVEVYDQTGKRVALIHEGLLEANTRYRFQFDAGQLASGVYIYRATGESFVDSRSVLLMK